MTRKMLDDQNLNTLEQVLDKTPGITVYDSPMGGKYFYPAASTGRPVPVRRRAAGCGWQLRAGQQLFQRHGVLRPRRGLKGAAGMMKGSGSSAGGVNFVRKRGQDKAATTVTLSAGSWDNYRGQVDVGGPLNESGTVRGRAVAALQDVSTSMTRPSARTRLLYGAIDWDISADTTLGFGLAYEDVDATVLPGLPRYADGSDLKLSRSTCLGQLERPAKPAHYRLRRPQAPLQR
jgi:outer membrane receptor for ferric coprogen and ferric-rhodotorulic acid